jgi:hypothetical protein
MAKAAQKKVEEKAVETKAKPELSMTAAQKKVVDGLPTVSARIRYLTGEGYSRSDITKLIPNASGNKLRYQHVRNVLEQKLASDKS